VTKKLVNVFIAVFLSLLTVFVLFSTGSATASAATITSENFPNTKKYEVIKSLKDGDKIEGKFFRFFVEDAYLTYEDGAWVEKNSYIVYLDENKEQKIQCNQM
jgi:DNA phosphorothioation-dependent restriction protein DptG